MSFDSQFTEAQLESLVQELKKRLGLIKYFGKLGDSDDLSVARVDDIDANGRPRKGFVRVRLQNDDVPYRSVKSGLQGAYNPDPGTAVIVGHDEKGELAIEKMDHDAIRQAGGNPLIYNPGDRRISAFKQTDSLRPLMTGAVSQNAGTTTNEIFVDRFRFSYNNTVKDYTGATVDLSSLVPTAGNHRYVGIFLRITDLVIELVGSTPKPTITPLGSADKQECYDGRSDATIPIALWRLADAQTKVTNEDKIEDLRPWVSSVSTETGVIQLKIFEDAMRQPTGFEKLANGAPPTDSLVTYNPATRTVSVAPTATSFNYWLKSERHKVTSAQQLTHADTTAIWFFYWNSSNVLTLSTTPWSILEDAPIAAMYYSSSLTDGFCLEERHGATRSPHWHYSEHFTRGTYWNDDGLAISGYTLQPGTPADADNQWAISAGTIHDEDITNSLTGRTAGDYEIFYRTGAGGEWTWSNNNVPLLQGGSYLYYNEWTGATWQLTAAANNNYVNYYIFAVPAIAAYSDYDIIAIMSQNVYSTLVGASGENVSDLDFGTLPFTEFVSIYKITFRTSASYTNEGKCRIEAVEDTRRTTREQVVTTSPSNSHPALAGLTWNVSGHLGTANYAATFSSTGNAQDTEIINSTTGIDASSTDSQLATAKAIYDYGGGASTPVDGWTAYSAVIPTRASADDPTYVLTFSGVDITDKISVGMKLKWTQNSTVRYGICTAISFSTNTTLTLYGGTDYDVLDTATYAISDFNYSVVKTPLDFPMDRIKWTFEVSDTTDRSQATPTANTWYNLGSISADIPIGSWALEYNVGIWVTTQAAQTNVAIYSGLSTSSSSESDSDFRGLAASIMPSGTLHTGSAVQIAKDLILSSKTTYYLISMTPYSNIATIYNYNSTVKPAKIRAYCNYL